MTERQRQRDFFILRHIVLEKGERNMSKVIIQCSSFMKPDDFERMKDKMITEFIDKDILVLPAYCSLKAVLDNESEVQIVEGE